MKNGFLHDRVLLAPLEACLLRQGATVRREHHVRWNGRAGFIDLFAQRGLARIAVEAELTPSRVVLDVAKAEAASASALLIVTPTASIARAMEAGLVRHAHAKTSFVWILPVGRALAWAERCFLMFPDPFEARETTPEVTP